MRHVIRPLWHADAPRIAGPAYTVRTVKHDNLMLARAIYHAEPGDVIVVQAGDEQDGGRGRQRLRGGPVAAASGGLVVDG